MLTDALAFLVEKGNLPAEMMQGAMRALIGGACPEAQAAAFLTALRLRGETAEEITAAVHVLREHMVRLDAVGLDVLDTCGTGGDGKGTFNISTAAALVVAACGVPVVKHGNRSVSSSSGSADVLTALGVKIDADLSTWQRCLYEVGLAFCFAPRFHPAMRHVAAVRHQLRFRTIFNLLGPLANPAGAKFQLLGVGRREFLDVLADCVSQLGTRSAYLVHGHDGLDEVSLASPTAVRFVRPGRVESLEWSPEDFGLPWHPHADLRVPGPEASAGLITAMLEGREGAATDVVLANVAAALLAAQRVATLREGVRQARAALAQGDARRLLERLGRISHEGPAGRG